LELCFCSDLLYVYFVIPHQKNFTMNINELTAIKIKELRRSIGFSAESVASDLGISKTALSQLENGKVEITLTRLESLSKVFNIPLENFLPSGNGTQTIQITHGENSPYVQHINNNNDPQLINAINFNRNV
jgi:transcriptional regulator with XRE-family HTH domain